MKLLVTSALHRLQKMPKIIRGFSATHGFHISETPRQTEY